MPRPRHCRAAPHAARQRTQPRAGWCTPFDAVDTRRHSHACVLFLDNHVACRRSPSAALCRSHVSLGRLRLCRARRRACSPRRCATAARSTAAPAEIRGCASLAVVDAAELAVPARNIRSPPWPVYITCGPNGSRLGNVISDVGRKPEVWEKPRRRSFAQEEWPCRQAGDLGERAKMRRAWRYHDEMLT